MADVRPLHGIHYNRSLLQDWMKVICPVYDIIPAEQREEYYHRSEYNFIRLEAGRELPQDTPHDNKYTRSAALLDEWLQQEILQKDRDAAIYVHDHYFEFNGAQYKRRGLIARVKLEEWDRKVIRPHESTLAEAKSDRLSLIWAIQANTSSILSLYQDDQGNIKDLLAAETKHPAHLELTVSEGEGHRVWAITDPNVTELLSSEFGPKPLYIADGHHRYESALAYRRQRRAAGPAAEDKPYDFVMMTLIDFNDPGLLILPPHRLVRGVPKSILDSLRDKLEVFFEIHEVPFNSEKGWETLDEKVKEYQDPVLVLYGISPENFLLLKPLDVEALAPMMPYFHTDLYKRLEVSIIDHVVLEKLLALSNDKDKINLNYCYDRQDAVNRVLAGEYQLTFILTSIKAEIIKAIADLGDKMPKKSTYFYPKVPAGLIVNRLV